MIFNEMRTKFQPPRPQAAPANTIPSQPASATPRYASTPPRSRTSGPASVRSSAPANPPLPLDAWEEWSQPTLATADQMEQLLLWLKPMPRCLITLRQMLETQQQRIDGMSTHLMTVIQELDTQKLKSTQPKTQKPTQPMN